MVFECILIPFFIEIWQNIFMTLEKTLIITLDDFIFDLYKIKNTIWNRIEKEYQIEVTDQFRMAYYDAHLEKREKLGREYPKIAPYFIEVENSFNEVIDNGHVEINTEHLEYLKQWNNIYKLIYCTNLKLDRMNNLLKRFNLNIQINHLISTKQVLNAKPEGDIYLKVARLLNIKANTITVIDSTLNGIQAAYLANTKGLYLAQFHEANSTIKKFAYAHFKHSQDLNHYVLNLISQSE